MTQFVVESLLHNLNSLIQKEFAPFLSFHQDLKKIAELFTTIEASLEDAEQKQFSDRNINDWLVKINDAAHMVDDMIDECAYEALGLEYQEVKDGLLNKVQRSCLSSFHLNHVVFGYKMAKKMKRISKRLVEIVEEKNMFNLTETEVIAGRGNEVIEGHPTTTFLFHEPLCGRQRDVDTFLYDLFSFPYNFRDALRVYPIEGVEGIGKTTFVKLIFHHQMVVNHFDFRIWVGNFWDFSLKGMMEAITKAAIGCDCEDLDLDILQKRLENILQRKRYLIVLDFKLYPDDHQTGQSFHDDWQKLKSILACGKVGVFIVVSPPKSFMGTNFVLSELSYNDSWALFRQQVFETNEKIPIQLEAIGKEILKKLERVPLAVKLLGGLLHFIREGREWLNLKEYIENHENIKNSEIGDPLPNARMLRSVLLVSYLNLPRRLKKCFVYCTIFPKGETIRKTYLIELWMANGFLSSYGRLDAEEVGNDVWNELYRRSFFQDIERDEFGNPTGFKMHNIVFDFARFVAKDVDCLRGDNELIYSSNIIHHLSDYRRKNELNSIDLQQVKSLRTYLIPNQYSDQLFPKVLKCHSLRVLEFRLKGELSPSIRYLKHLKCLNLSKSDFKTIPEFTCKLWNLQILKLDYCKYLQKLPNSLTDLKSLEKLSFKGCHKLSNLPPHMGKLTSLRSLTSYVVGNERGFLLAELGGMKLKEDLDMKHLERVKSVDEAREGNMSSKRLKELRLSWDKNEETKLEENAEKILEVLQPDTEQLVSLAVIGYPGGSFPRWVFGHSLKKLQIERCRELKGLHTALDAMTALHSLRLYDLPNLESLSDCFQHLHSLRQLAIGFCCKLTDFPNSLRASMLESLDIYGCYALEKQLCYWSTILLSCKIRVDGCLIT